MKRFRYAETLFLPFHIEKDQIACKQNNVFHCCVVWNLNYADFSKQVRSAAMGFTLSPPNKANWIVCRDFGFLSVSQVDLADSKW